MRHLKPFHFIVLSILNPWVQGGCRAYAIDFPVGSKNPRLTQVKRAFFEPLGDPELALCAVMNPRIQVYPKEYKHPCPEYPQT